jgi:clan AA aspartic protease
VADPGGATGHVPYRKVLVIRGVVNKLRDATIHLILRGPNGTELEIDAIVDTGYTGSLTLPTSIVNALGLPKRAVGSATMADGSIRSFDIHAVEIEWDGSSREVLTSAVGREPLLGMRLLEGYELRIQIESGGIVEVRKLP